MRRYDFVAAVSDRRLLIQKFPSVGDRRYSKLIRYRFVRDVDDKEFGPQAA